MAGTDHWCQAVLGEVLELKGGYDLPQHERAPGSIPIVSSSGIMDYHVEAKVNGPGVVTGRYGTIGEVRPLRPTRGAISHSLGSTGSLSRASTPKAHSCIR